MRYVLLRSAVTFCSKSNILFQAENIDSFAYQEVITPGQLFASVLKDALFNALAKIKLSYLGELRIAKEASENLVKVVRSGEQFELILRRVSDEISHTLNYFMSTGNIKTHQLDLQQLSGWTVVADRLNVNRFLSHFRAVHRGQFFTQMRTTEVATQCHMFTVLCYTLQNAQRCGSSRSESCWEKRGVSFALFTLPTEVLAVFFFIWLREQFQ